jgi:hypothetical protein
LVPRLVKDWCTVLGATVEIRLQGVLVSTGLVDAVTEDGKILWLHSPVEGRRLFEKSEFYQAWAVEEGTGFHYRISKTDSNPTVPRGHIP